MPPGVVVVNDVAGVIDPDGHHVVVEDLGVIDDDEDVSGVIALPGAGELPGHDGAAACVGEGLNRPPAVGAAGGSAWKR